MGREEFIRQELARLLRDWCIKAFLLVGAVFLLLSPLDYVSVPSLFSRFLLYRLLMAVVLGALALAATKITSLFSLRLLAFLAVFYSAATMELMIIQFHGHHSPYYAGMILLAVVALGFLPAGMRFHLFLAGTIYSVYLLPLLLIGDIHDPRTFFTQNYFLLFILGAGVVIKHFNLAHLRDKIGLHYDMLQQAENLESSTAERTEQLVRASDEWRVTFDSTQDMMMLVEKDGTIVKANKAMAAFANTEVKELIDGSCYDICTGNTIPGDRHPLKLMLESGKREAGEFYSARRDRWFLVSAEPLRASHYREDGAVFIMRDISGIKILEQGLLEAKEEWEETFNIIEEGHIHSR